MKRIFEAWEEDDGITFSENKSVADLRTKGLLSTGAKLLFRVEATTWEEASAIKHLRMGYEPYKPMGEPAPCPTCTSIYYPEGSGECWKCLS